MWEWLQRQGARDGRPARGSAARIALLVCVCGSPAAAQSSEPTRSQSALAEALFQEGKALMDEGQLTSACAKLAESYRIEPALGSLLNLAVCHEREGKTASAWSEYADALALAERSQEAERAQFARLRLEQLRERVPRLQLRVVEPQIQTQIELDGRALGESARDSAIPLDPGMHHLEVRAVGRKPWQATVELARDSGTRVLEVPPLPVEASLAPLASQRPAPLAPARSPQSVPTADGRRTWSIIAGGVALVGLGAGAFWSLRVAAKQSVVNDECDEHVCRSNRGLAADRDAHQAATWADISFGAGLAAGALSAYLWLSSRHDAPRATARTFPGSSCSLGPAALSIRAAPNFGGIDAGLAF